MQGFQGPSVRVSVRRARMYAAEGSRAYTGAQLVRKTAPKMTSCCIPHPQTCEPLSGRSAAMAAANVSAPAARDPTVQMLRRASTCRLVSFTSQHLVVQKERNYAQRRGLRKGMGSGWWLRQTEGVIGSHQNWRRGDTREGAALKETTVWAFGPLCF